MPEDKNISGMVRGLYCPKKKNPVPQKSKIIKQIACNQETEGLCLNKHIMGCK